jgi:putative transposase
LKEEVAKYVTQQIYRLCNQKDGVEVIEVNVQIDHVHIVVSIPPKYAVSQFMGFLKGKLALQLIAFPSYGEGIGDNTSGHVATV